jgi:hypothetical protein
MKKVFSKLTIATASPPLTAYMESKAAPETQVTICRMTIKLLSVTALTLLAITLPTDVRADAVTDWNAIASTAIVATAGQPPPVAALSFAMVQGAVYDAVNAIDGGYQPYLVQPPANPTDSQAAAAATAAFRILAELFPAQLATLQGQYDNYIASLPDEPPGSKPAGIAIGQAAAAAMSAARQNDGRLGPRPALSSPAPGIWRPTPPNFADDPSPWVGNVRPFLVPSAEMLRTDGPNALNSAAYAKELNELKQVGSLNSTKRSADQTDAAIFWQEHLHGFLNRVMRNLAETKGLKIAQSARLFAMSNMAGADAAIGCWNDKYYWQFWRPITAIREANSDGNLATQADATWVPLFDPATPVFNPPSLVTPPFPDHPSGHTCGTAAFMRTMHNFFGTDKIAFTATSNKSGTTRSFDRLSSALKEVIDARVWAGIHFRTADTQGAVLGNNVARHLKKHYFQPVK